jgi:hypothetical protein
MKRPLAIIVLIATCASSLLKGTSDPLLQTADLAWERGEYVAALTGYLQLLDSPNADAVLEPIALQTGELYRTTEITRDGALPQFSPDGRQFTYETGATSRRAIHLAATASPTKDIVELRGWSAAFSPDGAKLAYLKTNDSAELTAAQTALDNASVAERTAKLAALNTLLNSDKGSRVTIREIASGRETEIATGTVARATILFGANDTVVFAGTPEPTARTQVYVASVNRPAAEVTTDPTDKTITAVNSTGTAVLFTSRVPGAGGRGGGRGGGGADAPGGGRGQPAGAGAAAAPAAAPPAPPPTTFGLLSLADSKVTTINGTAPSFSGDGRSFTYVGRAGNDPAIMAGAVGDADKAAIVRKGIERVDSPALSADGTRVAFQMMPRDDWEIVAINRDGTGEARLTRDIQHDLLPQFLTPTTLLGVIGEPRHRRSFLYDVATGTRTRLFHNNTVRTIAPEYLWKPSVDGTKILIAAERDGDTVSLERGVYLMDLSRKVTRDEVRARVAASLAAEEALRNKGKRLYGSIADAVKAAVSEASVSRVYSYEKALFDFDSKHISRPGNKLAAEYLHKTYASFGYAPEFQTFERQNALGGKTSNVIATLKGTVNPELIYVVSSHYDSVAIGPGADDDSSGTAALLETARILAKRPQPATIIFASFTGEEAGLLGSREFVRRAVADKLRIVGALNNDMVGWANDARLDNTIRYSNPGIRDIQHGAAIQFTNLITYDALYYKGTDAAAYYEAFGDIVGGIGSYPVLSSPHYHQSHDVLENMNHQLITEVAKTTAATLMLLASSPSRLTDLKVDKVSGGSATLSWTPSPETGIKEYLVSYGPASKPEAQQTRVSKPTVTLNNVTPGTVIAVKAVNNKGFEGWDWARVTIQ